MSKNFKVGDKLKFTKKAKRELDGVINRFKEPLTVTHIEKRKGIYPLIHYKDVNGQLYSSDAAWFKKIKPQSIKDKLQTGMVVVRKDGTIGIVIKQSIWEDDVIIYNNGFGRLSEYTNKLQYHTLAPEFSITAVYKPKPLWRITNLSSIDLSNCEKIWEIEKK